MYTKEKSAFALEDTLAVYGIRKNPFPIDESDSFFFSTSMLAKQIEVLRNLVEYGDLLLVVSGVEGAGKTTFLTQFFLGADKRWNCCRIDARSAMTLDTLVDELLAGFGLSARGEDAQGDEALLRAHLTDLHASRDVAVVAVDDAHLLPQICTEFVLALAEERGQIELRLLLATEPGRLGFPTNDAKRVHVVVLQPFDLQQSGDYIHTRLSYWGLGGDSPFDSTVIEGIQQDSGGLPGTIHSLALHTLLANTDAFRLSRRPKKMARAAVYVAVVLAVAGAAAVVLWPEPGDEPVATGDVGSTGLHGRMAGAESAGPAAKAANADGQTDAGTKPDPFARSVTAKARAIKTAPEMPSVAKVRTGSGAKVFALDESGVSTKPAVAVESPVPVPAQGETGKDTAAVVRLAGNATPAVSGTVKSRTARDLDWLRKQDRSHYVIQLVGTRDAAAAGKFLDDHELGSDGAWFVTSHESKPWYVVVYGIYPSNASARVAIGALPQALRAGSPWPRSVASVVDSVR
ncbi:MAG: hypothetical protein E4H01_00435 [Lysobacterales bacterium]|nr:MAG: hypothetical protein E4H01_00435 [Xanthomonadales bacterium]